MPAKPSSRSCRASATERASRWRSASAMATRSVTSVVASRKPWSRRSCSASTAGMRRRCGPRPSRRDDGDERWQKRHLRMPSRSADLSRGREDRAQGRVAALREDATVTPRSEQRRAPARAAVRGPEGRNSSSRAASSGGAKIRGPAHRPGPSPAIPRRKQHPCHRIVAARSRARPGPLIDTRAAEARQGIGPRVRSRARPRRRRSTQRRAAPPPCCRQHRPRGQGHRLVPPRSSGGWRLVALREEGPATVIGPVRSRTTRTTALAGQMDG